VMLIAIGVADGIHLYSHLFQYLRRFPGATPRQAVDDMLKEMWKPVVMTSVTTAVGFISLLTSQVYPIKYFGVFTAFGVMSAMVLSLVLIPAGLLAFGLPRVRPGKTDEREGAASFAARFTDLLLKYRYLTLGATVVVVAVSLYGMTRVWINSSFLEKFEQDSEIVLTDKFINAHFGGTSTLNVILDAKTEGAFKDPRILRQVDSLQQDVVNSLEVVGNSFSLVDYLKRMNKVMHADSEEYNAVPPSRELVTQYLLLYEMSGDPENLWKVVNYAYNKANVTFQLKSDNSRAINEVLAVLEKHRPALQAGGVEMHFAGSGYKGLVFTDLILKGQIASLLLSLVIVVLLLSLMFRSLAVGLVGSVPIIITALISFGLMGLLNIPLSTTTALLSSIAVGIGIDYAVHFLDRNRAYAATAGSRIEAGRATMAHSGRAIVFNAVVVIAGFLVLLFSVFPPNWALGALVSLNMFTSFLGTVTVMYLLLYRFRIWFKEQHNETK